MASDAIGILGFALHAAHKLYDLAQAIKDAPREIRALQNEASLVAAMEPQLRKVDTLYIQRHAETGTQSHRLCLERLFDEAKKLKEDTDVFVQKVTSGRDNKAWQSRIKWILHSAGGRELTVKFKTFRGLVNDTCCLVSL